MGPQSLQWNHWSVELAKRTITVNVISPGWTEDCPWNLPYTRLLQVHMPFAER